MIKIAVRRLVGIVLAMVACVGIVLAAAGFASMGLAFSIAEKMEDVDDS